MTKIKFKFKQVKFKQLLRSVVLIVTILILPFQVFSVQVFGVDNHKDIPTAPKVALILGAGVNKEGKPSWVLQNRLEKGLELYQSGTVKVLLVSGDNRFEYYNEPKVMKEYLVSKGVPEKDIVEDFAGRRSLDSCYRAKNVFNAKSVYVVTQAFHMPRSVFLCKSVGLETYSAVAKDSITSTVIYGLVREVPASVLALFEVTFDKQAQVKGDGSERDLSQI